MKWFIGTWVFLVILPCVLRAQGDPELVWPGPPGEPRIRHLRSVSASTEMKEDGGLFDNIIGFLFGEKRTSHWLVQPVGIAVTGEGLICVADPGAHGVHMIDPAENEYHFIGDAYSGEFLSPVGCAVADDGKIYVTDSQRGEIVILDDDGDAVGVIRNGLNRPTGIQIRDGRIYVTDTGEHKVLVFTMEGERVAEFGSRGAGAGEFNFPVHLAVRDSIRVVDALNFRVQTLGITGGFGSTFGEIGNVGGRFASPKNIALDSDGNIYISDALMDNIQVFDTSGRLLLVFGGPGSKDGEFLTPNGVTIDAQDRIYVVDSLNRRIQIFQYYH